MLRYKTLACVAAAAMPCAAQTAPLTLQAVSDAAVAGNSQIRNERLKVDSYRGALLSRSSPFDPQLHASVEQAHTNQQLQTPQFIGQQATTYEVAASRQMRSGIVLSPSVQVTKSQYHVVGAPATGLASASVGLQVPLLYDRGGAVTRVAESVARLDADAVTGEWEAAVYSAVNGAVGAYWSYAAAIDRAASQKDAESRAERLLDETHTLIDKGERAPSDLDQLRANLASKRSSRILAEQAVVEARVQLGAAMGLQDPRAVLALGDPATPFPVPVENGRSAVASVPALLDTARANRADLKSQRTGIRAWELELKEYQSAALPRFDLVLTLGYQGFTEGGTRQLISPLYKNVPGLNAAIQFNYDMNMGNAAARGRVMQEVATVGQQRVALNDVERQVVTDVGVAALAVDRGAAALRDAESAVALYGATVENEKKKLRLGMSTLFDVINAEDALTNGQLNAVNARRAYAVALASLRLATGTLGDIHGDVVHIDAARLLDIP